MNSATSTRRTFLGACAAAAAGLSVPSASGFLAPAAGPAQLQLPLDQDWLFARRLNPSSPLPDDSAFTRITLPHCVSKLSWQGWDPAAWQDTWLYRRRFTLPPEFAGHRVFVQFDGVMVASEPSINNIGLSRHLGGYLPFSRELTASLKPGENLVEVSVDATWQQVPPAGSPKGPAGCDYFVPGGIPRSARLYAVPQVFLADVFAKPVDVLSPGRRLEVACTLDAATLSPGTYEIEVKLVEGSRVLSTARKSVALTQPGKSDAALTLTNLRAVKLWDLDTPHLYDVVTTLTLNRKPIHQHRTRVGFREARFSVDGFFLNGRQVRLFGLNRHELYPYVGSAMPPRVMRRDAQILKHELNCNIVRCSHYPQSPAFLEACDELGLMVWEEPPGWQYIGDAAFEEQVVENVQDMILRDRNHASIVIWGVRVNESRNDQPLYQRTTALAKSLDDSRPTSGSMTNFRNWQQEWHEDVFAMDDYHSDPSGGVGMYPPLPGVPYMLAETVGQFSYGGDDFHNIYRRAGDLSLQTKQALYHAEAHDKLAAFPRSCGTIAWCAFEYASPQNSHKGVKNPGVSDTFRIPKLGASFYQAQLDPKSRPVIAPSFYWDFGPSSPHGPGPDAIIFSNCDRLELFLDGKPHATLRPDRTRFPHTPYPPFFANLEIPSPAGLRIDAWLGGTLALSRSFSADPKRDRFLLTADDQRIFGDGADATRVVFRIADAFGNDRAFAAGDVTFELSGPATLVGDNPFSLTESGGAGAVWLRALPSSAGDVTLTATHSRLGKQSVRITVQPGVWNPA